MSDRLISADVLKSSILQWQFKIGQDGIWYVLGLIDSTPTIEAEPVKHGTWGENIYGYRKCSVCGRVTQVDECMREPLYLYCPYCGAKMDEEAEA